MDRIDSRLRRVVNRALSYAALPVGRLYESVIAADFYESGQGQRGIVFIVGAPRTGSTLLYQILTNVIDVVYLSNFANLFYHSLLTGMILHQKVFGARPHNSFVSDNGRTRRWIDPSESGKFWYQWYPKDIPRLSENILAEVNFSRMVRTIRSIQCRLEKPLIFKNQTNSQRVSHLARLFPDSIFIHVTRDPFSVARSIIRQRRRFLGSADKWYSIKPEDYEEIRNLDYVEQVVKQIYGVDDMIRRAFANLETDRCLTIRYEELPATWQNMVDEVRARLSRFGRVEERLGACPPKITPRNAKPNIRMDRESNAIVETIRKIYH